MRAPSRQPRRSGVDLDFDHAEAEVENPGAWDVNGLGSRSGRGST